MFWSHRCTTGMNDELVALRYRTSNSGLGALRLACGRGNLGSLCQPLSVHIVKNLTSSSTCSIIVGATRLQEVKLWKTRVVCPVRRASRANANSSWLATRCRSCQCSNSTADWHSNGLPQVSRSSSQMRDGRGEQNSLILLAMYNVRKVPGENPVPW